MERERGGGGGMESERGVEGWRKRMWSRFTGDGKRIVIGMNEAGERAGRRVVDDCGRKGG